ncbi:MFS transporter [Streptomyces sp. NEAU-W12]|uniref:MFS transporter n=1 Tax=Streptomyces sp. NEAU-W12 TaxID=2994668 RepID=UPI00224AD62A|nr:MFS transporter [Streptomyces sp. NEAU-W12]MCX2923451.1 MFS transporter [Streptomyces sp. NEAU-W12]
MSHDTSGAVRPTASVAKRLDRLPVLPTHRRITTVIGVGLLFDMYENNLSGTLSQVLHSDFALSATDVKLVLASVFLGQFFGAILMGRFADRFGRRQAFLINLAVYSFFSLAGAFSPSVGWLIATRFLAGIGIGAEQTLSDSYLADVLPARHRGRLMAWAYTIGFCGVPAVGLTAMWLVPLEPLGVAGWRWLFALGALGSVVVWVWRRGLFESPRWLAAVGRNTEAEALTTSLEDEARRLGKELPEPGVRDAAHPLHDTPQDEPPAASALPIGPFLRQLFSARYRRRTVQSWILCLLSTVGYYGFGTLAPMVLAAKGYDIVQGLGYSAAVFIGYPVGALLAVPLMDRFERRSLVALSATGMALAGLGFAFAGSPGTVIACGFAYTLVSNVFSSASHVFLAEQYPTPIRAQASGTAYSLSKLTAAALPFVLLPILEHGGPGMLFATIAAAMGTLAAAVFLLADRATGHPVNAEG